MTWLKYTPRVFVIGRESSRVGGLRDLARQNLFQGVDALAILIESVLQWWLAWSSDSASRWHSHQGTIRTMRCILTVAWKRTSPWKSFCVQILESAGWEQQSRSITMSVVDLSKSDLVRRIFWRVKISPLTARSFLGVDWTTFLSVCYTRENFPPLATNFFSSLQNFFLLWWHQQYSNISAIFPDLH